MTKAEYEKLYLASRNIFQIEQRKTMIALRNVYETASERVSRVVRNAEMRDLSSLTIESQRQLSIQLQESADELSRAIEQRIPISINKSYSNSYGQIDKTYIMDIVDDVPGAGDFITRTGINNMIVGVNDTLIKSMFNRVSQNGQSFSQRIWETFKEGAKGLIPSGINGDYQYRIENVVSGGIAQGRPLEKIAQDIQVYTRDGKIQLIKRWGKLERGTSEFSKRLSGKIDWRALRLVRSELYASIQDAGIRQGEFNPAALDLYNWEKTPGNPIDQNPENNASGFRCIDLQGFSPYKRDDVPSYQHSNCSCSVVPVLMDRRTFEADLNRWVRGGNVDYINDWYSNQYLPAQL